MTSVRRKRIPPPKKKQTQKSENKRTKTSKPAGCRSTKNLEQQYRPGEPQPDPPVARTTTTRETLLAHAPQNSVGRQPDHDRSMKVTRLTLINVSHKNVRSYDRDREKPRPSNALLAPAPQSRVGRRPGYDCFNRCILLVLLAT